MRSLLPRRILCSACLAGAAIAQAGPDPLPADLAALATRVDAAHHPGGAVDPVTQFAAALEVHLVGAEQEQGGQVDLIVDYLRWQRPGGKSVRHLIKYEVERAGRPIQRGRDRYGFWHLFQGEAKNLTEADVEDRQACKRDTMLARQLVRFLDPGAVMRSLTDPTPVADEGFKIGRLPAIECRTVEGSLAEFPLLRLAGSDHPVRIKLYVRKADGRLLAVLARPERNGVANEAEAELIRLSDYEPSSGMLIPKKIEHLFRNAEGALRTQSRVFVTRLDLRPNLSVDDLDRPK